MFALRRPKIRNMMSIRPAKYGTAKPTRDDESRVHAKISERIAQHHQDTGPENPIPRGRGIDKVGRGIERKGVVGDQREFG